MADNDGYVRGETLDVFLDLLEEEELGDLFEEEMDNIIVEVIFDVKFKGFMCFHLVKAPKKAFSRKDRLGRKKVNDVFGTSSRKIE